MYNEQLMKKIQETSITADSPHVCRECRQKTLSEFASFFYLPMSESLANDESVKCRKLTALAIKSLLVKKERQGDSQSQAMDHLIYNSLNTLSKVLQECGTLLHSDKWTQNMNIIFDHVQIHLRHPHVWVQLAAAQLFGMLFASYKPEDLISKSANLSGDTIHGYLETNTTTKLWSLALSVFSHLQSHLLNEELACQLWSLALSVFSHLQCHLLNEELACQRSNVFKWLAVISLNLGSEMLIYILPIVMPSLQRELIEQSPTQADASLRQLAGEVMELLKKLVGVEDFTKVYAATQKIRSEKRETRKQQRAVKAVSDPEFAAKRKIKKNLAKQVTKKRRIDELRPSRKAWKQNYQEVTAD